MKLEVCIPQQGNTTDTVNIVRWLKDEGEMVKKGEVLLETESEKAVLEVESPADGKLVEILIDTGAEVDVGVAVALIETDL